MIPFGLNSVAALLSTLVPLIFTVPNTSALRVWSDADSAYVTTCAEGARTSDVKWIRAYRWSLDSPGLGFVLTDSLDVTWREGTLDTLWVDAGTGASFYITAVDTAGNESCASNVIFWGPESSVEVNGVPIPLKTHLEYFDVHGRKVAKVKASGVYFWQLKDDAGRVLRKGKTVLVR